MLIKITDFDKLNKRKLMDVYQESNTENVPYFYPDCKNLEEGVKLVEDGFINFLRTEFFANSQNAYYVLEENGEWVSALRLNLIKDGVYYIEALETRPDSRKRGYGAKLLKGVLKSLTPPFTISSSVGKRNAASIKCHEKCGFTKLDCAYDLLSGEKDEGSYGFVYGKK